MSGRQATVAVSGHAACEGAWPQGGEHSVSQIDRCCQGRNQPGKAWHVLITSPSSMRENLEPLESLRPNALIALAVFFGKTRLIDNLRLT